MTTDTATTNTDTAAEPADSATRSRVALLAIVLGVTALLSVPAELL